MFCIWVCVCIYVCAHDVCVCVSCAVVGAHPQNYQNFMAVLCNYIVERQRDVQGDYIPFSTVYVSVLNSIQLGKFLTHYLFLANFCFVIICLFVAVVFV